MARLESLLVKYVEMYGFDLKAIRQRYCGMHCGDEDLNKFKAIYYKELEKYSSTR